MLWKVRLRAKALTVIALVVATIVISAASAKPGPQRTLRVSAQGQGLVLSGDGRIRCGRRCSAPYAHGAVSLLRAVPGRYFRFDRWTGRCVGSAPECLVALDGPVRAHAVFVRKTTYFEFVVGGPGAVSSEPGNIDCGGGRYPCAGELPQGLTLTLTARPHAGGTFRFWGDDCASATETICRITVGDAEGKVRATFGHASPGVGPQTLTITGGPARVTSDPPGIDCPDACSAAFPSGTAVTLRLECRVVQCFWGRDCAGAADGRPCALIVDAPTEVGVLGIVDAGGTAPLGSLDVTVAGRGRVSGLHSGGPHTPPLRIDCARSSGRCSGRAPIGAIVTLRATPTGRARLARWSGPCRGSARNSCPVRVGARSAVAALFRG
jgi:Divergent InlB B-repeat domain